MLLFFSMLFATYKKLLEEYIAFASISTDSAFSDHMHRTAKWLEQQFVDHGFATKLVEGCGNPIVLARYEVSDPEAETVLIYGHYDVQPAEKSDGRESDPFVLTERDGKLFARGAVDNKGQCMVHIASVFDLIQRDALAYNVVFMIEGDEETGSPTLPQFIQDYKDDLKADFSLVSDGEIIGDSPMIETGFRGGVNITVDLRTAKTELHSGAYGGIAPSASHELAVLISKIYDPETYRIQIPGFYDHVEEIDSSLHEATKEVPYDTEAVKKITGIQSLVQDPDFLPLENLAYRPTVQITGMHSGYVGEGYKNGIPPTATGKFNFRLVKGQDPLLIVQQFKDFLSQEIPSYVSYTVQVTDPYKASRVNTDNTYVERAANVLEKHYGKPALYVGCGG